MVKEQVDLSKQWTYVEARDILEDEKLWQEIESLGLPEHIFDVHVHSGLKSHVRKIPLERLKRVKTLNNMTYFSLPMMRRLHQSIFTGRNIDFAVFPFPYRETQIDSANNYLLKNAKENERVLILGDPLNPDDTITIFDKQSSAIGVKSYYDQVVKEDLTDPEDVAVFDFFPHDILEHLNKFSGVIMLHVPRTGGLANAQTLSEVVEAATKFPNIKIVLAHMGRCYSQLDMEPVVLKIAKYPNLFLDTSMVDSQETFEVALRSVGSKRIMFGTDLPLSVVRFLRKYEEGILTLFSKQETHALKIENKPDMAIATNVLYMTRALLIACQNSGLTASDKEDVFYNNAKLVFSRN